MRTDLFFPSISTRSPLSSSRPSISSIRLLYKSMKTSLRKLSSRSIFTMRLCWKFNKRNSSSPCSTGTFSSLRLEIQLTKLDISENRKSENSVHTIINQEKLVERNSSHHYSYTEAKFRFKTQAKSRQESSYKVQKENSEIRLDLVKKKSDVRDSNLRPRD